MMNWLRCRLISQVLSLSCLKDSRICMRFGHAQCLRALDHTSMLITPEGTRSLANQRTRAATVSHRLALVLVAVIPAVFISCCTESFGLHLCSTQHQCTKRSRSGNASRWELCLCQTRSVVNFGARTRLRGTISLSVSQQTPQLIMRK